MTPRRLTPQYLARNPRLATPLDQNSTIRPHTRTQWWRGKDSNLRRRKPADLQSAPVGRLGTPPRKNEPRILVATPRSVNGIGATLAKVFGDLFPRQSSQ